MVVPKEIGFRNLIVRPPDILLETETGTFLLDAASGGLTTLIEIAALVYTCGLSADVKGGRFTVTFDEPENHLHPSMQRSLMPSLIAAFPEVQFIVVTHSPFIVSSMRDSNVYALHYAAAQSDNSESDHFFAATRQIVSTKLDYQNRAGTAGEILREVLGVPVTLPVWVENSLDEIVAYYQARQLDENTLAQFRLDVQRAGLEELFPEAISRLGG